MINDIPNVDALLLQSLRFEKSMHFASHKMHFASHKIYAYFETFAASARGDQVVLQHGDLTHSVGRAEDF